MSSPAAGAPIVVTGGAGAIGTHVVRALLADGHPVRVLDNLSSGRREHLDGLRSSAALTLHVVDVRNADAIRPHFEGASAVWHLAANPDIRLGTQDPNIDFDQGTLATFRVLEAARKADVKSVVFSSSSTVYGYPKTFPTPEEYGPLVPESLYGAAKLAAEGLVSAYAHSYGLVGHIFRFANIIGPEMTHGVIPDFFEKLHRTPERLEVLGDGNQSKSYLRVEECVAAMQFAVAHSKAPVSVYNLGTHDRTSVREIAQWVVAARGGRAKIEYTGGERGWVGDIPQQLLSIEKIARLGWTPKENSSQAVHRSIDEYARAHPA